LVLRNALTLTVLNSYTDFVSVGGASLAMVADLRGVSLTPEDRAAVAEAMTTLPAHDDVERNLVRLAEGGYRLAALTNSPQEPAERQLVNAGIAGHFERILSVGAVGRFKPSSDVYDMAAGELAVPPARLTLVAAHDWDIAGAMRAGWRGAYVMRLGTAHNPLFPHPNLSGPDLDVVTDRLLSSG
jgi:2-haloacid dehalogenase